MPTELARFRGVGELPSLASFIRKSVNNIPPSDLLRLCPSGTGGGGRSGRGSNSSAVVEFRGKKDEVRVGGAGGNPLK